MLSEWKWFLSLKNAYINIVDKTKVQQSWKLYVLLPIGISNPKTKLVLLEKGLNCQRNLSFGGLNKKGQNNRTRLLLYLVSSSVQFCWNFFSSFFPFQSLCSLKALLNFLNYFYNVFVFQETPWIVNLVPETTWA